MSITPDQIKALLSKNPDTLRENLQKLIEPERPAFVRDGVIGPQSLRDVIIGVDEDGNPILDCDGACYCRDITHLDGAKVSKAYPPIADTHHISQLLTFDQLEPEPEYRRLTNDDIIYGARGKVYLRNAATYRSSLFYKFPKIDG